MVYPSFTAGGVFTSNVLNSVSNKRSALGIDLSPKFDATLDNGIHRTTVYGAIDAQIYPGVYGGGSSYPSQLTGAASSTSANSIQGRAGVAEVYARRVWIRLRGERGDSRRSAVVLCCERNDANGIDAAVFQSVDRPAIGSEKHY